MIMILIQTNLDSESNISDFLADGDRIWSGDLNVTEILDVSPVLVDPSYFRVFLDSSVTIGIEKEARFNISTWRFHGTVNSQS